MSERVSEVKKIKMMCEGDLSESQEDKESPVLLVLEMGGEGGPFLEDLHLRRVWEPRKQASNQLSKALSFFDS